MYFKCFTCCRGDIMGGLSPWSIGWTAWTACKACEACTGVHCIANMSMSLFWSSTWYQFLSSFLSRFLSLFLSQFLSLSTAQCICYCNDSKLHLYKFKSSAGEEGRVNSRRDTSGPDSHESLLVKLLGDLTTVPGAVCPVDKCLPAVAHHTLGSSNP